MRRPDTALDTALTNERRVVIALTVFLTVAMVALVAPTYLMSGDPDYYVGLARSIADGNGLTFNGAPGVKYPPGFPVLLTPAAALFDGSFTAIARWSAAIGVLAFPLSYWMLRKRREEFALPLAIASVVTVVYLRGALGNPMSEPVFLAWTMALLAWADGWEDESEPRSWPSILLGSLLVVGAVSIRTIGMATVVAAGMLLGWRMLRRTAHVRDALPFAAGTAFAVAWFLWSGAHRVESYAAGPDAPYMDLLFLADSANPDAGTIGVGGFIARALDNLVLNAAHTGALLGQLPWLKVGWFSPAMLLVPLITAGMWRHTRRGAGFAAWFFLACCGILALWPFNEQGRFLIPLTPLLMLFAIEGLRATLEIAKRHPSQPRLTGLVLCVAGLAGVLINYQPGSRQDLLAAACWLAGIALVVAFPKVLAVIDLLGRKPHPRARVLLVAAFAGAGIVQIAPEAIAYRRGQLPKGTTQEAIGQAAEWLNVNADTSAIILTTWPSRIHFATGRRAIAFPATGDREILRRHGVENRSDYLVVLADPEFPYVRPSDDVRWNIVNDLFPGRWTLAAEMSRARIYRAAN